MKNESDIAKAFDHAELLRRAQDPNRSESTLRQGIQLIEQLDAELKRRKSAGEREFTKEEAMEYFKLLQKKASAVSGPATPIAASRISP